MSTVRVIAMGASLGGLEAIERILAALPSGLQSAIAIAQHRRADEGSRLVELLCSHSVLPVSEPEDKEPIRAAHVYLAPADYHLLVEPESFALSTEAPVCYARPSIDVLFESVADSFGDAALGVILTGASDDGAAGAALLKQRGGTLLVQDPRTAESPILPAAVLATTWADEIVELDAMADRITARCTGNRHSRR